MESSMGKFRVDRSSRERTFFLLMVAFVKGLRDEEPSSEEFGVPSSRARDIRESVWKDSAAV